MRSALAEAPGVGTVAIGEGEKDGAPMHYSGERVGAGGPAFDIAVDPLECTTFCAKGLPGASPRSRSLRGDTLLRPGPSHCVDKLVGPPEARDAIDISDSPEANATRIAVALGKEPAERQARRTS
jgi:fructose-1,6-bisphosphatase II